MFDCLPLRPNAFGVGRLVGDAPMHVPRTGVASGFEDGTDQNEVRIRDAIRGEMVAEEYIEGMTHPWSGLKGLGFGTQRGDQCGKSWRSRAALRRLLRVNRTPN